MADDIVLTAMPVERVDALIGLFERRHDVLPTLPPRSAFRPLMEAPPEIEALMERSLSIARAQIDAAVQAGQDVVELRLPKDAGMVQLIQWAAARFRLATSMLFPGSVPEEWESALKLYTQFLEESLRQIEDERPVA